MFRRLTVAVAEQKRFAEKVKYLSTEQLFDQHDASARCVCDMLVRGYFYGALSSLAQYVVLDREINRRIYEV